MTDRLQWLEVILEDRVQAVADRTSPWSRSTTTFRVDLARHGRVAVQIDVPEHRPRMRRRVSVSRFLARAAPTLRLPEVIVDGTDAETPFVVTRWADGRPLSALLATPFGAVEVATRLHAVLAELNRLPPAPSDLPTAWADPVELQRSATGWLAGVGSRLDTGAADAVARSVERAPAAIDFGSPAFAHGDVVPVNILVDDRGTVTLLDFEDARVAPRAFDRAVAWTTLALHHPEAAAAFERPMATVDDDSAPSPVEREELATIGCLARLERAFDAISGFGDEAAAMDELVRAAGLVAGPERAVLEPRLVGS